MKDYTPTDNCCYIVSEAWTDQPFDIETHYEYMFVPAPKLFKRNSWGGSKKEAEFYYVRRLKEIRTRKLMFPAVDKRHFTLTLSYASSETDSGKREFIVKVIHDQNMPYDDDFKDGLFKKLKRDI